MRALLSPLVCEETKLDQLNRLQLQAKDLMDYLMAFHRYEAVGIEHLPKEGPCLLVVSHSLATYDCFLLGMQVYEELGRLCVGLGDRQLFKFPMVDRLASSLGLVQASQEMGLAKLAEGKIVAVAPGGMREALRSSEMKYSVNWSGREGFIKLAKKARVKIVLAACPAADDIFTVYENPVTKFFYRKFRMPFPLVKGWGPTFTPRPVKLIHQLSRPIDSTKHSIDELKQILLAEMENITQQALQLAKKRKQFKI